ncbi:zinc finger protein [Trichonephila clavipes]|nr:zinc finger protein [Trichonephila clavipes]
MKVNENLISTDAVNPLSLPDQNFLTDHLFETALSKSLTDSLSVETSDNNNVYTFVPSDNMQNFIVKNDLNIVPNIDTKNPLLPISHSVVSSDSHDSVSLEDSDLNLSPDCFTFSLSASPLAVLGMENISSNLQIQNQQDVSSTLSSQDSINRPRSLPNLNSQSSSIDSLFPFPLRSTDLDSSLLLSNDLPSSMDQINSSKQLFGESAAVECSLLDSLGTDSCKFSVETELSLAGGVREGVSVSKGETKVFRLLPGEVVGMGICNKDSLCIVGSIPDGEGKDQFGRACLDSATSSGLGRAPPLCNAGPHQAPTGTTRQAGPADRGSQDMLDLGCPGSCTIWRPETQNSAFLLYPLHGPASSKTPPHQSKVLKSSKPHSKCQFSQGSSPLCHHTNSEKPSQTQLRSTQSGLPQDFMAEKIKIIS